MASELLSVGTRVLCYSREWCKKEKRPRDMDSFSGVITKFDGENATVLNRKEYNMYYHIHGLKKINE